MLEQIAQIGMATFGLLSVYSIGVKKDPKMGCLYGFLAEPFWFTHALLDAPERWGILILALAYSVSWGIGVYNYWIKE